MPNQPALKPRRRPWRLALLVLAVALAHVRLMDDIALSLPVADAPPPRLEVAFVRELAPSVPPVPPAVAAVPVPPPPAAARPAKPPKPAQPAEAASAPKARPDDAPPAQEAAPPAQTAASAPQDGASEPVVAEAAPTVPEPAAVTQAASDVPPEAAAAVEPPLPLPQPAGVPVAPPVGLAAGDPIRDWPPSTQLEYTLTGWYRGDVHGSARVSWLRQDRHYQVHLEVVIGPGFAPLMSRRISSDGEVGPRGLEPRRYDEETRLGFLSPRRSTVRFEPDAVVLSNGARRVPLLGAQDSASQFVQLTWMFTLQPGLLQAGRSVEIPLALPNRLEMWTYDVLGEEQIDTPLGTLAAVHVKPRREPVPGIVMTAEAWFAPSLQYLPVRFIIHQAADVWVDLRLKRLPLQGQ